MQERVTRIQQLRESLDDEMKKSGSTSVEKTDSSQPVHNKQSQTSNQYFNIIFIYSTHKMYYPTPGSFWFGFTNTVYSIYSIVFILYFGVQ